MSKDIRKPRVGDRVAAIGQDGTFEVTAVNEFGRTADLEAMPMGKLLTRVPWTALSYGTNERELQKSAERAGDRNRRGKRGSYDQGT
jgi:hypothetical protein